MDIKALAKQLGEDLIDGAGESLKEVSDDSKEFFMYLGSRYAAAYQMRVQGNAEGAERSIRALNRAAGSEIAERGLDFVEGGEAMLMTVLKTVGKVVLTLALA